MGSEDEFRQVKEKLAKIEGELSIKSNNLEEVKERLIKCEEEARGKALQLYDLEKEKKELLVKISELEKQINSVDAGERKTEEKASVGTEEKSKMESEIVKLQSVIQEKEKEISQLKDKCARFETDLRKSQTDIQEVESRTEEVQQKYNRVQKTLREAQDELDILQSVKKREGDLEKAVKEAEEARAKKDFPEAMKLYANAALLAEKLNRPNLAQEYDRLKIECNPKSTGFICPLCEKPIPLDILNLLNRGIQTQCLSCNRIISRKRLLQVKKIDQE